MWVNFYLYIIYNTAHHKYFKYLALMLTKIKKNNSFGIFILKMKWDIIIVLNKIINVRYYILKSKVNLFLFFILFGIYYSKKKKIMCY